MIKGADFEFGNGQKLTVPPLSLGDVETLQDRLQAFRGGLDKNSISITIDATLCALQRNYPEMTREEVAQLIDLGNMGEVMALVMGVSGLVKKDDLPGEGTPKGSTGTSYTPT